MMKKRQAFQAIREKCRAKSIQCGFRNPIRLVVMVNNTGTFTNLAEAEKFLSCEVEGWDIAVSAAASQGMD